MIGDWASIVAVVTEIDDGLSQGQLSLATGLHREDRQTGGKNDPKLCVGGRLERYPDQCAPRRSRWEHTP